MVIVSNVGTVRVVSLVTWVERLRVVVVLEVVWLVVKEVSVVIDVDVMLVEEVKKIVEVEVVVKLVVTLVTMMLVEVAVGPRPVQTIGKRALQTVVEGEVFG